MYAVFERHHFPSQSVLSSYKVWYEESRLDLGINESKS